MPATARSSPRLTYADFLQFPDDGKRHEIIDGVHYVTRRLTSVTRSWWDACTWRSATFLSTRRHLGRVFLSPLDVVMSNYDVVEPDLLFVAGDQQDILTEANVQGPPALVIEVLSQARASATRASSGGCSTRRACASTGWWTHGRSESRCSGGPTMARYNRRRTCAATWGRISRRRSSRSSPWQSTPCSGPGKGGFARCARSQIQAHHRLRRGRSSRALRRSAPCGTRVEREPLDAFASAPGVHGLHQSARQALAAMRGLDIDIERESAPRVEPGWAGGHGITMRPPPPAMPVGSGPRSSRHGRCRRRPLRHTTARPPPAITL